MTVGAGFELSGTERFEIQRRLGAGGMGVVYEAFARERNTRVALETLRHVDAQTLYRFKREFRALQDLEHPNLVSLGELVEEGGRWFFTMELIEGVDFLAYSRPGPEGFDEVKLRAALGQLALGLVALHDAGKVHRDVKPSNIRVTPAGRGVLLDLDALCVALLRFDPRARPTGSEVLERLGIDETATTAVGFTTPPPTLAVPFVGRAASRWLWGRLCLAAAAEEPQHNERCLRQTARMARRLERERTGFATAYAKLLRGGLAVQRGNPNVVAILRDAITAAQENQLTAWAETARHRLGELLGGHEDAALVAEAGAWMARQGLLDPDRAVEVLAPGLRRKAS